MARAGGEGEGAGRGRGLYVESCCGFSSLVSVLLVILACPYEL